MVAARSDFVRYRFGVSKSAKKRANVVEDVINKIELRPYQETLATDVLKLLAGGAKEVCLAAAPGAGKTQTAIEIIRRCVCDSQRVLVIAHGTNVIRTNFVDRLKAYDVGFDWHEWTAQGRGSQAVYDKVKASVVVTIYQSFAKIPKPGDFDLVVVDEAHENYQAKTVQEIIKAVGSPPVLLLTGTPAVFVARQVPMVSISAAELLGLGMLADPLIELGSSSYDFKYEDYNTAGDHPEDIPTAQTNKTLDDLLIALVKRLEFQGRLGSGWTDLNQEKYRLKAGLNAKAGVRGGAILKIGWGWKAQIQRIGKTMISCRSIKQAEQVGAYFRREGVEALVSHSENDKLSENMARFKADPTVLVLVVVDRGTLGFDCEDMANAVDLTGSINVDRIFQFLCRVVRLSKTVPNKLFVKLSPRGMTEYTEVIMSLVCQLGAHKEFYEKWDGRMRHDLPVRLCVPRERQEREKSATKKGRPAAPKPVAEELVLFRGWQGLLHNHDDDYAGYVWTTLGKARELLLGVKVGDPAGTQQEIRNYYSLHEKLPGVKHPLYGRLASYCSIAHGSYDKEFHEWAISVGRGNRAERGREEIRAYYSINKKLPNKEGDLLYDRLKSYCRKNAGGSYDKEFHEWAISVGYGSLHDTASRAWAIIAECSDHPEWEFTPSNETVYSGVAKPFMGTHTPGWGCGEQVEVHINRLRAGQKPGCKRCKAVNLQLGLTIKHPKSGYYGVYGDKMRWCAKFNRAGHLGNFVTKEEAARAYDAAVYKHLGERARRNFPNETPGPCPCKECNA